MNLNVRTDRCSVCDGVFTRLPDNSWGCATPGHGRPIDPRRVIAMVPGYWGKGATLDEAKDNARKAGARGRLNGQWLVKQLPEGAVDVYVDEMGNINWFWLKGADQEARPVVLESPTMKRAR